MPVHRIELELPRTDVEGTDVRLSIWSDDELLGGPASGVVRGDTDA